MIIRLDPEGAPHWLLDIREVQRTPDAAGAGVIAIALYQCSCCA